MNDTPSEDPLPLARYRFTAYPQRRLTLRGYTGSLLRGVFGNTLRQLSCLTRAPQCTGCLFLSHCPYPQLFQPPPPPHHPLQQFSEIPPPYVVEPPAVRHTAWEVDEPLVFHWVLIGHAIERLPIYLFAWQKALQQGLTDSRIACELREVAYCPPAAPPIPIYSPPYAAPPPRVMHPIVPPQPPTDLQYGSQLLFLTPLRLKAHGQIDDRAFTARTLLNTLMRRYLLLCDFHGSAQPPLDVHALAQYALTLTVESQMAYQSWARYSSRQQREMDLGGFMGSLTLRGDLTPFAELLVRGEGFHLGGKTTFGLGHYQQIPLQS